jgi:hypothetical protein
MFFREKGLTNFASKLDFEALRKTTLHKIRAIQIICDTFPTLFRPTPLTVVIYLNICARIYFNFKSVKKFLAPELSIPGNCTSIIKHKPQSCGKILKKALEEVVF